MTDLTRASKKLSYLLRHAPADVFPLSRSGWADVTDVCKELKITREQLQEIVDTDEKGRYKLVTPKFGGDSVIKAVQGHSTPQVAMEFPVAVPPRVLYHGTPVRNLDSIIENGLNSGERQYVHLSADLETATQVGLRGTTKAVILQIGAEAMHNDGVEFYLAENGVWLVDAVITAKYLAIQQYADK